MEIMPKRIRLQDLNILNIWKIIYWSIFKIMWILYGAIFFNTKFYSSL